MSRGDPALIICLGPTRDSWAIRTDDTDLVSGINFLGATRRSLGALAAFAATALLGEESADPGAVDEVASTGEGGEEEKVEEDSVEISIMASRAMETAMEGNQGFLCDRRIVRF